MRLWFSFLVILLLLSPTVFAQEMVGDPLQPLWDAISELRDTINNMRQGVGTLRNEFDASVDYFNQFQQDVNSEISNLHMFDDVLLNGLNATNVAVQENTDSINVHSQEITDLNQTAAGLQTQIDTTNTTMQNNQLIIDQKINDLNTVDQMLIQTDASLQNQINTFSTGIDRGKLYEVVNNDVNQNKIYCNSPSDILLFGVCPSGFSGSNTTNAFVLFDNFDDQDYTNNPTWNVRGGSWAVNYWGPNSGKLITQTAGGNGNLISTSTPIDSVPLTMEVKVTANNYPEQLEIGLSDNSSSIWNGYLLRLLVNYQYTFIDFHNSTNGTGTQIAFVNGFDLSSGVEYIIKATRDEFGYWQLFLNGSPVGQPFHDSTHTHFSDTFLIGYQISNAGSQFDDVSVTTPQPPTNISPFLNLNDINSAMGIGCKTNGVTRALCLQQN